MWDGPTFQVYYAKIDQIIRQKLDQEDPAYLLGVDFDEYLEYLIADARWEPLEWDENQKSIEPFTVKVQRRDERTGRTYQSEQSQLRIRIPISLHPQLDEYFKFGPSTTWAFSAEPKWSFENSLLVFDVEETENAVESGIEAVRFWLGNRNKDIETGNKQLKDRIFNVWEAKRKQLEQQQNTTQSLLQKLNMPLYQDPDAKAKPLDIRPREFRTAIEKPRERAEPEPALNRNDVVKLVDFIDQYTRQFEVAPRTYVKLGEEELRDLLIGMMNVNYPGSVTGETFNKLGKTDISLRIDSGHVLVCECKFWAGAKAYQAALNQLFDYLTWRQNFGVLISFCKVKDMSRALEAATQSMTEHPSFKKGSQGFQSDTRFVSRHCRTSAIMGHLKG